jgi:hypothetical protein
LNFCALWKKQTTLPSLAYAGIPYQSLGARAGALALMIAWSRSPSAGPMEASPPLGNAGPTKEDADERRVSGKRIGDIRLILTAGVRLISCGSGDTLPSGTPRRSAMSPIVCIVFAPVIVGVLACAALLLGAACTGVWEAAEERARRRPSASESAGSTVAPHEGCARAA